MLLMVSWEDMYLYPLVWVVGILLFIALVIAVFVQLRTGRKIRSELAELEKVRQGNIEYEFILRAMKLCTWHIDAASRTLTIESDFREGQDNYVPAPDTPVEIIMAMVGRADRQRVRVALDDLCTGRSTSYHEQYQVKTSIAGLIGKRATAPSSSATRKATPHESWAPRCASTAGNSWKRLLLVPVTKPRRATA